MSIREVALLGADGKLGPHVLHALLAHGFRVTILKRASSKSKDDYAAGIKLERVPDDFDIDAVTEVVKGKDAVVVTIKGSNTEIQDKLAQACVKAGVTRFIPVSNLGRQAFRLYLTNANCLFPRCIGRLWFVRLFIKLGAGTSASLQTQDRAQRAID